MGTFTFLIEKKGTGIRKINRKGNGNEEYTIAYNVVLDEDNEELL